MLKLFTEQKLRLFLISLLVMIGSITSTSYAQTFQVTAIQLKQTNLLFNELEYLRKQTVINDSIINIYQKKDSLYQKHDKLLQDKITYAEFKTDSITNVLYNTESKLEKTTKKYKKARNFAIGGSTLSLCLLVLLLL
jgi:hypothetical protein